MALDRVVRAQASLEVANPWLYSIRAHANYEALAVRAPTRRGELLGIPPVDGHAGEDLKVRHAASPCCCLTTLRISCETPPPPCCVAPERPPPGAYHARRSTRWLVSCIRLLGGAHRARTHTYRY